MKQDFICAGDLHFTANWTFYVNGDAEDNANPGTEEVSLPNYSGGSGHI